MKTEDFNSELLFSSAQLAILGLILLDMENYTLGGLNVH